MPLKGSINPHLWKYKINIDFFKRQSSQMAYILGFLLADGRLEPTGISFVVGKKKDKPLLEKINQAMESNYPIEERKDGSFRLRIFNPIIIQDLRRLGCNFGKMKNSTIPNISSQFFRDFVRGYLDGDGWITGDRKDMEISIGFSSGNQNFLQNLIKKLNRKLNLSRNNLRKKEKLTKNNKISIYYQVEYYSNNAYKIIRYLYDNLRKNDLFLLRKYQKQLKAREIYEDLTRGTKLWRRVEDKYKLPMEKLLFKLYKEKGLNGLQIAQKLDVHSSSIYRWLSKTGIRFSVPKQRTIIIKKCLLCNKEIIRYKGRNIKYCSPQCRLKARQTGKFVKCIWCGKKIYRPGWWFKINKRPFCSRECRWEWQRMRINKNLIICSKENARFLFVTPLL